MVVISPISIPEDGRLYEASNVKLKIDDTQLDAGSLYITNNSLLWQADGRDDGISIPWTKISLHAISLVPVKCVYFMLDYRLLWPGVIQEGNGNGNLSENDDDVDEGNYDGDDGEMTQMWLQPAETDEVEKIYNAMVQCQILNPDLNDTLSLSEEEEFMEALDENEEELGAGDLQNLNIDDGRYSDANED